MGSDLATRFREARRDSVAGRARGVSCRQARRAVRGGARVGGDRRRRRGGAVRRAAGAGRGGGGWWSWPRRCRRRCSGGSCRGLRTPGSSRSLGGRRRRGSVAVRRRCCSRSRRISGTSGRACAWRRRRGPAGVVVTGPKDPWAPDAIRGSAGLHFALAGPAHAGRAGRSAAGRVRSGRRAVRPGSPPADALLAFGTERDGLSDALEGARRPRRRAPDAARRLVAEPRDERRRRALRLAPARGTGGAA